MFVAKTTEEMICTLDYTAHVLQQMRRHMQFVCPCCEEPVTLKIGTKKRPHFAHNKKCISGFSEGESAVHAEGKASLYTFFTQKKLAVQLEPYIASLQQRPDLLVGPYAIEFQYSALSVERMKERTEGYEAAGYVPIWLPYARHKRAGWQLITVNELERQCMQTHGGLAYCVTFSPEEQAFIYYKYSMQLSATKFYTYVERIALHEQHFPFYVPRIVPRHTFEQLCSMQQKMRVRLLQQRLRFSQEGVQDTVLHLAYTRYGSLLNTPPYIGIYVPGAFSFPRSPLEWQLYFTYWYEQGETLADIEARFCALYGVVCLTAAQQQAIVCYEAILADVLQQPHTLFSQMYDKIVAIHA